MKIFLRIVLIFISLLLVVGAVFYFGTPKKVPLSEQQLKFAGEWRSDGDITLLIQEDGTGNYVSAGTTIQGAPVYIDGSTITLQMAFIKKQFQITQPPHVVDDTTYMELNHIRFRNLSSSAAQETATVMTPKQGAELNRKYFTLLNAAVQAKDAQILHDQLGPLWMQKFSAEQTAHKYRRYFEQPMDMMPFIRQFPDTVEFAMEKGDVKATSSVPVTIAGKQETYRFEILYYAYEGQFFPNQFRISQ